MGHEVTVLTARYPGALADVEIFAADVARTRVLERRRVVDDALQL